MDSTNNSKTFVINKHIKLRNTISPHIKTFDQFLPLLTEGKKIHATSIDNNKIKNLLECNFSTSTQSSITVSRIVLLDAFKSYFAYVMEDSCGIPKVTLKGTLDDWLRLQEKFLKLKTLELDLDFWLDRL